MRLQEGQKAIPFMVKDIFGHEVSLQKFENKKILLSFYRFAACPLCNLRVDELITLYPFFEKENIEVVAVFQSSIERIKEFVGKQNPPFPIVSDPKSKLFEQYGVENSTIKTIKALFKPKKFVDAYKKGFKGGKADGDLTRVPADFLIGEDGILRKVYYGKYIGDHMPIHKLVD
ncbi:peroxiredoxin-like family protein [Longirhabdus pacifica]|uniref:peroxiredoxin-like family protein n=1 Tax=Longirhabdus pacifica TaxID=2305227 RepID=UPI0010087510|nr:peroxiredoxin-like family protein [Longirhabdus pacifica]